MRSVEEGDLFETRDKRILSPPSFCLMPIPFATAVLDISIPLLHRQKPSKSRRYGVYSNIIPLLHHVPFRHLTCFYSWLHQRFWLPDHSY
jgi:hypothetical protein